jgi:hypothetical protein
VKALARLMQTWGGYSWRAEGAAWAVRDYGGRWVLFRNGQPLSAVQYQGRQMDTWSEFVYAGRGYRLAAVTSASGEYTLTDEDGQEMLHFAGESTVEIALQRPLPQILLTLVALRALSEKKNENPSH